MNEKRAAWREPMVWLVLGLPAVAIVASLGLVYQAVHAGPDDGVIDEVIAVPLIVTGSAALKGRHELHFLTAPVDGSRPRKTESSFFGPAP